MNDLNTALLWPAGELLQIILITQISHQISALLYCSDYGLKSQRDY